MSHSENIAKALGKCSRTANGWLACCPAHDDHNPSLSLADGNNGRLLVHCYAGCDARAVLAALARKGLYNCNQSRVFYNSPAKSITKENASPLNWSEKAEKIWQSTIPIFNTPAETYLRNRGCFIPNCEDLRFLPARAI